MIKLLILDIDGVMTDGTKYYGLDGIPFAKTYCDKDFTAIKRFRAAGIHVCFLSGDAKVNEAMAKKRNIDFYLSRGKNGSIDKALFVPKFEEIYDVKPEDMGYVGDDVFDLSIMEAVGHAWCTSDAPNIVKEDIEMLNSPGGGNVVMELYDKLSREGLVDATMDEINKLDKNEKF